MTYIESSSWVPYPNSPIRPNWTSRRLVPSVPPRRHPGIPCRRSRDRTDGDVERALPVRCPLGHQTQAAHPARRRLEVEVAVDSRLWDVSILAARVEAMRHPDSPLEPGMRSPVRNHIAPGRSRVVGQIGRFGSGCCHRLFRFDDIGASGCETMVGPTHRTDHRVAWWESRRRLPGRRIARLLLS
jgi:hypothetical protein